ncbi:CorA metal ion transporter [Entomophthora muscae]|uniref:CorA metal ion transporter n=1 Tax=Entomophthora muscae TaxID=34485 RepID=A0ACC2TU46_9FUNG|nr:CorA metal ion transporter [Entomophthora muscae]
MKDRLNSLDLSGEKALLTPSTEHDQCIYSASSSLPGSPFAGDTTKTFEEARLEPLDRFYSSCHPIAEKLEVKGWKIFALKKSTIETISFGNAGESLESFHNYKFLSTLAPKNKSLSPELFLTEKVEVFNIFSVILAKGILTFQKESMSHRTRVLERISKIGNTWTLSPGWIAYALLDEVVDSLLPLLRACEEEAERFEDLILNLESSSTRSSTHSLNQIARLKQHIFTIAKLVSQKHDICQTLTKKVIDANDFRDGMHLYFGDVQDHILSLSQSCIHLEKNLTTTHLNYCDQLTLTCIQTDHATFDQTMLLTYVGSGISVLICISGFFGINTYIPYNVVDEFSRREPYYVILAIGLLISILIGYLSHIYAVKKIKGTKNG